MPNKNVTITATFDADNVFKGDANNELDVQDITTDNKGWRIPGDVILTQSAYNSSRTYFVQQDYGQRQELLFPNAGAYDPENPDNPGAAEPDHPRISLAHDMIVADVISEDVGNDNTNVTIVLVSPDELRTDISDNTEVTFEDNSAEIQSVTNNGGTLAKDVDYTVEYTDSKGNKLDGVPTAPGSYSVTITGIGAYKGSVSQSFKIPLVINNTANYDGVQVIDSDVVIKSCSNLIVGSDSTLTINGSVTLEAGENMSAFPGAEGESVEALFETILSVDNNSYVIINGDLTLNEYSKIETINTGKIIVAGKITNQSSYDLSDSVVTTTHRNIVCHEDSNYFTFDGSTNDFVKLVTSFAAADIVMAQNSAAVTSVKYNGIDLAAGTDYELEYYSNGTKLESAPASVGEYTVKITGKGDYADFEARELSFNIYAPVSYKDEDGKTASAQAFGYLASADGGVTLPGGTYVVKDENTTIDGTLTFTDDAVLILEDGASLTVNGGENGIDCEKSLTVYGQENGTGTLAAAGTKRGIHCDGFTLYGGNVDCSPNNKSESGYFGLYSKSYCTLAGGSFTCGTSESVTAYCGIGGFNDVTVSGGTVNVKGVSGIASIYENISITGGTVTAEGSNSGISANNGNFTISGGKETATGTSKNGIYSTNIAINGGEITSSSYFYSCKVTLGNRMFCDNVILDSGDLDETAVSDLAGKTLKAAYAVSISDSIRNGTVTADTTEGYAAAGQTVTLNIEPADDCALKSLTVMQGETPVTVNDNKFTMPAGDVTVGAEFVISGYCGDEGENENGR